MKFKKYFGQLFSVILLALLSACGDVSQEDGAQIKLASFNFAGWQTYHKGVQNWTYRRNLVAEFFKSQDLDICGAQEVCYKQFPDFLNMLGDYGFFGKSSLGEADGRVANVIFYKKSRFTLLENETFWLTQTPEKVSKELDSDEPRTVNYGKFLDKKTGKTFFFFSTHFDHKGEKARERQAEMLISIAKRIAGDLPIIIVGDFNCIDGSAPITKMKSAFVRVPNKQGAGQAHYTYHAFTGKSFKGEENFVIDHIFISKNVKADCYNISTFNKDGIYPSDHFPTTCNLKID